MPRPAPPDLWRFYSPHNLHNIRGHNTSSQASNSSTLISDFFSSSQQWLLKLGWGLTELMEFCGNSWFWADVAEPWCLLSRGLTHASDSGLIIQQRSHWSIQWCCQACSHLSLVNSRRLTLRIGHRVQTTASYWVLEDTEPSSWPSPRSQELVHNWLSLTRDLQVNFCRSVWFRLWRLFADRQLGSEKGD